MKLSKCIDFGWVSVCGAAAVVLSMAIAGSARAGLLENFESAADPFATGPHTGGYVADGGAAGTVLTPDNTMNSPNDVGGSWSMKIVTDSGFNFGALRFDHGVANHYPQWLVPNNTYKMDVFLQGFTDFAAYRFTYQSDAGQANSTTGPDTSFHALANQWQTLSWTYPPVAPAGQTFWLEWLSLNSNGPITMFVDNIRTEGAVPEPASVALLGLSALGMFVVRRKRT